MEEEKLQTIQPLIDIQNATVNIIRIGTHRKAQAEIEVTSRFKPDFYPKIDKNFLVDGAQLIQEIVDANLKNGTISFEASLKGDKDGNMYYVIDKILK